MNKQQDYSLADISACRHCSFFSPHPLYEQLGVVYCENPRSPLFHNNYQRVVKLIFETLPGCEHFSLKERVPQSLYRYFPSDSPIRRLPLEQVISDYDGSKNLMSTKTSKQVLEEIRTKKPSQLIREMVSGN